MKVRIKEFLKGIPVLTWPLVYLSTGFLRVGLINFFGN